MSDAAPVPSPCVNVCALDPASGLCLGCWRTIDEIAAWGALDDEAKRAIVAVLAARAFRETDHDADRLLV